MALKILYRCDVDRHLSGGYTQTAQLTVVSAESARVFTVNTPHGYTPATGVIQVGKYLTAEPIASGSGVRIELVNPLPETPQPGWLVRQWDGDLTRWRVQQKDSLNPLQFTSDADGVGFTGNIISGDLVLTDWDNNCPMPEYEYLITIIDTADPNSVIWSGKVYAVGRALVGPTNYQYRLTCKGWADVADELGIEEQPQFNVNAGKLLKRLVEQYTTLTVGDIDTVNSPTLSVVRIGKYRRLTELGKQLQSLWPGSSFWIEPGKMTGIVNFKQASTNPAPVVLDDDLINQLGPSNCKIELDTSKTYNIIRYPYWREKPRPADRFVQASVTDAAFLKSTIVLSGQPTGVETSFLVDEDFSDGEMSEDWLEDDLPNPTPPNGFNSDDGHLLEGVLNGVTGLHMLANGSANWGDIGRFTDPTVITPWTGDIGQMIMTRDLVINQLGDGIVMGILDPTTYTATVQAGSTTTVLQLTTNSFKTGDKLFLNSFYTYITAVSGSQYTVSPALPSAPAVGDSVTLHRQALSRVRFGVLFKASGSLAIIVNGLEVALSPTRTYTANTTYSVRLVARSWETSSTGTTTATGCDLVDATGFAAGDVVELYTNGERVQPVQRVITGLTGSSITYADTGSVIKPTYRVKTLPKLVLQIKGGAYGSITGRDWVTLWTSLNTWQTVAAVKPLPQAILMVLNKTLVATISEFYALNPPPITGLIGNRYLHIATQEVESSDPDVDCIIRKVGSHYQLDFFPDTKQLWSSGSTLNLFYKERERAEFEDSDLQAMRELVGDTTSPISGLNEKELRRQAGKTLATIELLPEPIPETDAISQASAILSAAKWPRATVSFTCNDRQYGIFRAGQLLQSNLTGIPSLIVNRVSLTESIGEGDPVTGRQVWIASVTAGSIDRLNQILVDRRNQGGRKTLIDDGRDDDSATKLTKTNFSDTISATDLFKASNGILSRQLTNSQAKYNPIAFIRVF